MRKLSEITVSLHLTQMLGDKKNLKGIFQYTYLQSNYKTLFTRLDQKIFHFENNFDFFNSQLYKKIYLEKDKECYKKEPTFIVIFKIHNKINLANKIENHPNINKA